MCSPLVLTGIQVFSQIQQANAQNAAIAKRANQTARNAVAEAKFNYGLIETREQQDGIARMLKMSARMREGVRNRASLEAQVAEQSGEATSLRHRLSIASKIQENEDIGGAMAQADFERERGMWERLGVKLTAQGGLENARLIKDTMVPQSTIMAKAGAQLIEAIPMGSLLSPGSGSTSGVSGSAMSGLGGSSMSGLGGASMRQPQSQPMAPKQNTSVGTYGSVSRDTSSPKLGVNYSAGANFVGSYMNAGSGVNNELIKAMLGL